MGSGASVQNDIDNEIPWEYSQEFIDKVRKEITGNDPLAERKLEFQKQVRMLGDTAEHRQLIRTVQASVSAAKKASLKSNNSPQSSPKSQKDGEPELSESDQMQKLILSEMKEKGIELNGQLAIELERRKREEEERKAAGKPKKKKKKKKKGTTLVSIQTRLSACSEEPFGDEDLAEFLEALDDINGDDMGKTKEMLENFQFSTPTVSREALRLMDFPFVHGCIIGILERAGYQPDLITDDEKDELKFEGRRAEETFLIKIAAAVAYDLGTINPATVDG